MRQYGYAAVRLFGSRFDRLRVHQVLDRLRLETGLWFQKSTDDEPGCRLRHHIVGGPLIPLEIEFSATVSDCRRKDWNRSAVKSMTVEVRIFWFHGHSLHGRFPGKWPYSSLVTTSTGRKAAKPQGRRAVLPYCRIAASPQSPVSNVTSVAPVPPKCCGG
jgi:hypothetical protein